MKQPKHWQDWINAVAGVWLVFAPLALGFYGEITAMANSVAVGLALLALAMGAIFFPLAWEDLTETIVGIWLVASPWVLGWGSQPATISAVVTGLLVLTLALWAVQDRWLGAEHPAH